MSGKKFELEAALNALGLESYISQFEALGIRSLADFQYVEDGDLVQWGLTTIQRRKFFRWRDENAVEGPSLAQRAGGVPVSTQSNRRSHQGTGSLTADFAGHAALLSAAERVLSLNGPQPLGRLRERLQRLDNGALGLNQLSDDNLCEALNAIADATSNADVAEIDSAQEVTIALRLQVGGDVIFNLEPVVLRLGDFLALRPEELLRVGVSCKAAHASGLAQSSDLWLNLLWLWYPKASLEDPEAVERAREARASAERGRAQLVQHLRTTIGTGKPVSFMELWEAARGAGDAASDTPLTPPELLQTLSRHPEVFKQQPGSADDTAAATLFCIEPMEAAEEWQPVNPYQDIRLLMDGSMTGKHGSSGQEQAQQASAAPSMTVSRLDPRAAFRLFHTGLLTSNVSQERSQKGGYGRARGTALRSWEYLTEGNMRAVRPAGELLDDGDQGVKAIRKTDPQCVHTLVLERLDGVVYHVSGCFNRRVQLLTAALQGGQLLIEREKRKQFERKLLEFMENVRKERAFGFFFCPKCSSRWRSGFTYEEIGQECLQCGILVKPYRITELQSKGGWPGMRRSARAADADAAPMLFDGRVKSVDLVDVFRRNSRGKAGELKGKGRSSDKSGSAVSRGCSAGLTFVARVFCDDWTWKHNGTSASSCVLLALGLPEPSHSSKGSQAKLPYGSRARQHIVTLSLEQVSGHMCLKGIDSSGAGGSLKTEDAFPMRLWVHVTVIIRPDGDASILWNGDRRAAGKIAALPGHPLHGPRALGVLGEGIDLPSSGASRSKSDQGRFAGKMSDVILWPFCIQKHDLAPIAGGNLSHLGEISPPLVALHCSQLPENLEDTRVDDNRDELRSAGARVARERFQRLELPLGGKNANEGATFFAKVEQDVLILAEKFGFQEARVAPGHGRISWQVELSGVCSNEALADARAELQELLAYHGLHMTQEAFVDRHERQMAEQLDMLAISKRAEAANSRSMNQQRKAKAPDSGCKASEWQEWQEQDWKGWNQHGTWWKDAWAKGSDSWSGWRDGASWAEAYR